jgi:hypothetical protein
MAVGPTEDNRQDGETSSREKDGILAGKEELLHECVLSY